MSRKLATTIKDSAIPGKYKRIAEAYAAFANNDGTNIYPSQPKLGKKAGTSPDTVQRVTPDLVESGILKRGETHTCRIDACNKGSWHFSGRWGRHSKVYEIQIDNLQNAVNYLSAKCGLVNAAKCRKLKAAKCGTTQALSTTPVPASPTLSTNPDSSALTSGEVVSHDDSLRSSSSQLVSDKGSNNQNEKENQPRTGLGLLPKQEQPLIDLEIEEQDKQYAINILDDQTLAHVLGLPYFTDADVPHAEALAYLLRHHDRSASWLQHLVMWMLAHSFWKKRLHAGPRAMSQLVKHVANGELVAQFNSHLTIQRPSIWDNRDNSTCFYWTNAALDAIQLPVPVGAGFEVEELE